MDHVQAFEDELKRLKKAHLFRSLKTMHRYDELPTHMQYGGRNYILFCSNDYLGLSHEKRIVEKARTVMNSYGTGAGASRLISGTTDWHTRLEESLARFKRKPRALIFQSGYMANLGIITGITDKNSLCIIDKTDHASIIDACRLSGARLRIFPHKNMDKLEAILAHARGYNRIVIITDSLFSMDGDQAPLRELIALKKKYNALLMLDEAHATGVFGSRGSGLAEEMGLEKDVDIAMGTLSKAFGTLGGYCAVNTTIADYIINKSRPFIYTTSLPAHMCAAAGEALTIIEKEPTVRERLWENILYLHNELSRAGFVQQDKPSPIMSVHVGSSEKASRISADLLEAGFFVPAIRYPTVAPNTARLRVTVSRLHTRSECDALVAALKQIWEKA
jgi:8-amino-7-oxononanoate synthase